MKGIKFIKDAHQYIDEEGKSFTSVSAFTERFKEKQDWGEIARKSAAKLTKAGNPVTGAQLQKKWKEKAEASAAIGTLYHEQREKEIMESATTLFDNVVCRKKTCPTINEVKHSIPINDLENNTIYPELMICDSEFRICGQSDKIVVANNKINVLDYKTDKEIAFKAYSSEWVSPRKLLPPLQHLDECNANIYSIKMSMYLYLLWKANKGRFKAGDIVIEHIIFKRDPDNDNMPVLKDGKPIVLEIKKISLPYRKKEIQDMLKTIKK